MSYNFGAASGWVRALDVDFSTQANQTLSSDTTYTIGGISGWKKENSTNDQAAMAIVNGAGLVISPKQGSGTTVTYYDQYRSSPLLWLPFSQFLPAAFDWESSFRATIEVSSETNATLQSSYYIGYDSDSMQLSVDTYRYGGTLVLTDVQYLNARVISGAQLTVTNTLAASGVISISTPSILGARINPFFSYGGPSLPSLAQQGTLTRGRGIDYAITTQASLGNVGVLSKMGLLITAACTNANTYSVTIKHVTADYKL